MRQRLGMYLSERRRVDCAQKASAPPSYRTRSVLYHSISSSPPNSTPSTTPPIVSFCKPLRSTKLHNLPALNQPLHSQGTHTGLTAIDFDHPSQIGFVIVELETLDHHPSQCCVPSRQLSTFSYHAQSRSN